jgi:hypothetical protein
MTTTRLAVIVRVLIALCTRTFFQPDEYFQSLEPAHYAVFGYAHLTWEWLAPKPIRSIFYPALNIPIFWALKVSGLAEIPLLGNWLLVGACLVSVVWILLTRNRSIALEYCTAFWQQPQIYGFVKLPIVGSVASMSQQR